MFMRDAVGVSKSKVLNLQNGIILDTLSASLVHLMVTASH